MRVRQCVLAAILGVSQVAAAAPASESMQSARVMRDRFYRCAHGLVPDYDDRMSAVNIVAKAVAAKCQMDALNWLNAMLTYMDREDATELHNEVMRGEEGNLVAIVLRHRVLKSAPPTAAASEKSSNAPGAAKTLK